MADDVIQPAAPAPESAPAPIVEPAPVETAAPTVSVAPEAPAASEAPKHTDTETLLEAAQLETPKPAETPAPTVEGSKTPDASEPAPSEAPKLTYEQIKLPEGLQPNEQAMGLYREKLGKYGISAEAGQELMDLHGTAIQAMSDHMASEQHRVFGDMRKGWRDDVMADPQLGGAGHQTAMKAVARMRDMFMSSAPKGSAQHDAEVKQFNDFLRITGAGDHPAFLRFIHNTARKLDEPTAPANPGAPPPNRGAKPKTGRLQYKDK